MSISERPGPAPSCTSGETSAQRLAALEQRVNDLDAFSRHVAHELQTPLGQLEAIAALLQRHGADDAFPTGLLQLVGTLAADMRHIVSDVLDMARASAGTLATEAIDLTALCWRLSSELSKPPSCHPVMWDIQTAMVVQGNRPQITLLMRNLLSNAVKYTKEAAEPTVTVSTAPLAGGQRITVQDNGAGFDAGAVEHLFQPFGRLHSVQRFPGTGLGLSIARRIVDLHRGWVRGSGQPGVGARFEVWLPCCPAKATA